MGSDPFEDDDDFPLTCNHRMDQDITPHSEQWNRLLRGHYRDGLGFQSHLRCSLYRAHGGPHVAYEEHDPETNVSMIAMWAEPVIDAEDDPFFGI